MIVLDTNVVSETFQRRPTPSVLEWLATLRSSERFLTATVAAELLTGVSILPSGRRRTQLDDTIRQTLEVEFVGAVLSFDARAAQAYAQIFGSRRAVGHPISFGDAQIAAVCLVHDAALATRNIRDFAGCGIQLVNPWEV